GCQLHAGTVRRWLPSAGLVWRRAAPTLRIRDPHKDEKMSIRYFQKGSGHITFKRLDLMEKMNDIVAKHYPGMLPAK
ncbi:DUF4942 domain-containing protein, partial [Salmonella enterica]|uniref:DUF4942 domain-containing protein n=2 Tax=Salmonella TaxID=590 RepID=UPI003D28B0DD